MADFSSNGQVIFPHQLLNICPELVGKYVSLSPNREDKVFWRVGDGTKSEFKSSLAWNDFRETFPKVPWLNLVWFSNAIPKHAFILWLAIQNKLLTQERMHSWNLNVNDRCAFCNYQRDSVNHLFFNCQFSQEVCRQFSYLGVFVPMNIPWSEIVDYATANWTTKSLVHVVNKIVLGSLVYFIWQERNLRLFQHKHRTTNQMVKLIKEEVRLKILGLKIRKNIRVFQTLRLWNISWDPPPSQNSSNELVVHGVL